MWFVDFTESSYTISPRASRINLICYSPKSCLLKSRSCRLACAEESTNDKHQTKERGHREDSDDTFHFLLTVYCIFCYMRGEIGNDHTNREICVSMSLKKLLYDTKCCCEHTRILLQLYSRMFVFCGDWE